MSAAFSAFTGWTLFSGLTLAVGAVVARWLILPRCAHEGDDPAPPSRAVASIGLVAAGALLVGVTLYFVRQLIEFRDPFAPWSEEARLLLGTDWGRSWLAAAGGTVALTGGFGLARRSPMGWWVATPVALALAALPAFTGHAAASELRTVALVADTLHVWAAGAWIGSLSVVMYLGVWRRGRGAGPHLTSLVGAFSPVAMAAVGLLIASGTFASLLHLESLAALWTTGYGRTLLLKLLVVAGALALGAINYRIVTPRLGAEDGERLLSRTALAELVLAHIVLIVTAVLVRTSPAGH